MDDSELAPVEPAPSVRDVVRPPEATPGGVDNVPVETMSDTDQLLDELDHARLDQDGTDLQ